MTYSQKYTLVHFIHPVSIGTEFDMYHSPLHTTIADVFAIEREQTSIDKKLAALLASNKPAESYATNESILGTTHVTLLQKTEPLLRLHNDVVDLLENNGAVFNTPEFTRSGFLPHVTIQQNERISPEEKVIIDSVSLIDMFPDGNWQQRKVLATFFLDNKD